MDLGTILAAILIIIAGAGIMGFGLFLFYALLPLFYAFFGVGVGIWLGAAITGNSVESLNLIELIFGVVGGVIFAGAAYFLEPFRRILIGIGLGGLLGGVLAGAFGWTGILGVLVMVGGAVIGAIIVLALFDPFVIGASAFGGAGLVMDGIYLLVPSLDFLNRSQVQDGGFIPILIWLVLGSIGLGWQFMNLQKWAAMAPAPE